MRRVVRRVRPGLRFRKPKAGRISNRSRSRESESTRQPRPGPDTSGLTVPSTISAMSLVSNGRWASAARETLAIWGAYADKSCEPCPLCVTAIRARQLGGSRRPRRSRCSACPVTAVFGGKCLHAKSPYWRAPDREAVEMVTACLALLVAIFETGGFPT